jgi:hypothetical protein
MIFLAIEPEEGKNGKIDELTDEDEEEEEKDESFAKRETMMPERNGKRTQQVPELNLEY